MKNILIAGASSMIGGLIVQEALKNEEIKKVISIQEVLYGLSMKS